MSTILAVVYMHMYIQYAAICPVYQCTNTRLYDAIQQLLYSSVWILFCGREVRARRFDDRLGFFSSSPKRLGIDFAQLAHSQIFLPPLRPIYSYPQFSEEILGSQFHYYFTFIMKQSIQFRSDCNGDYVPCHQEFSVHVSPSFYSLIPFLYGKTFGLSYS